MLLGKDFSTTILIKDDGEIPAFKLYRIRRELSKSQSFCFLVFTLLVTYIVLGVFLPDSYNRLSLYSDYEDNHDANSSAPISNAIDIDPSGEAFSTRTPSYFLNLFNNSEKSANTNTMPKLTKETNSDFSNASYHNAATTESSSETPPLDKIACQIPRLNAWDESIKHLIKAPANVKVDCPAKFPLLFKTYPDSTVEPLTDAILGEGYENCCYRTIHRKKGKNLDKPDNGYRKSPDCFPIAIKNVTQVKDPDHEFIAVYCNNSSAINLGHSSNETIVDMFNVLHLKPTVEERINNYYSVINQKRENRTEVESKTFQNKTLLGEDEKLNVVILGLDAVSHMNFIRTMPKSYEFLIKNLSAVEMHGFNKIGDNTYPNLAAVLTSLNVTEMKSCESKGAYDNCPFIWKDYASKGYRTSFGEDSTWLGIFNYFKVGFRQPPTDYYLRPFGEAADALIGTNKRLNTKLCHGPRLSFHVLLDYMEKLAFRMGHGKRYFQLIWATSMTHDDLSDAQLGDKYLLKALQWFSNHGYLEHTAFILMSDHGIRWGKIHDYVQGDIEERLPFLYFVMPERFQRKYSRAYDNLRGNTDRLTTPYDLHETLKDLLYVDRLDEKALIKRDKRLEEYMKSEEGVPKGISQFLTIPPSRTCGMAGVETHYCTCHKSSVIPTTDLVVRQAANYIVYSINLMISKYSECAFLTLGSVKRAEESKSDFSSSWVAYQLVLETIPGGAVFKSSVEKDDTGFWKVSGTIGRTNLYGNQSHCVENKEIKLYCFCVDMM